MESLVHAMLSNALAVTVLAVVVACLGRTCRCPAVIHGFCLVLMVKLVTPPVVPVTLPVSIGAMLPETCAAASHIDRAIGAAAPSLTRLDEGANSGESCFADLPHTDGTDGLGGFAELSLNDPLSRDNASKLHFTRLPHDADRDIVAALSVDWKWEHLVVIVVLVGALGWWTLATVRITRFQRVLKEVDPVPGEWQAQASALAQRLGLSGSPAVCLVPGRVPPMLWALGNRPRLLLPSQLWSAMSPDERTSLLIHELAHLKRRDHWVRWFELIVAGLYWWHPAVWWIRRSLREAEEQCCDAWVLWVMPQGAKTYAAAALTALEFVSGARTAPAAASATSGNGHVACLKRRMRMIVLAKTPKGLSWTGRLAVLATAALLLPLAPSWAQKSNPETPLAELDRLADFDIPKVDLGPVKDRERQQAQTTHPDVLEKLAAIQKIDEPIEGRIRDEFQKDPQVVALLAEFRQTQDELERVKEKARRGDDPARRAAERQLKKLTEEFNSLWQLKHDELLARSTKADDPDDDKKDDKDRQAAERFEETVKDLIDKLAKEIGPVADEVKKALDRPLDEISKSLDKKDLSADDLRQALEKSHDGMRRAFESGGPVDKEVRDAWERSRQELREAWDRAREDLREAVRDRGEAARERRRELLDRARSEARGLYRNVSRPASVPGPSPKQVTAGKVPGNPAATSWKVRERKSRS